MAVNFSSRKVNILRRKVKILFNFSIRKVTNRAFKELSTTP